MSKKYIDFWIDDLFPNDDKTYIANILLNNNSVFNPPYHMRKMKVSSLLLEKDYYIANAKKYDIKLIENNKEKFRGHVVQGGYYKIPKYLVKETELFSGGLIGVENEIFKKFAPKDSPFKVKVNKDKFIDYEKMNTNNNNFGKVVLYCFNVGQGDTFLLITSSGSPYIIDTNFYSKKKADKFISLLKEILHRHGLSEDWIKGLIITHKHIDHIRGARYLIETNEIKIDNFLINMDYEHETKPVTQLLELASTRINNWVNVNREGLILEGNTAIFIRNPNDYTKNKMSAPDINDSSICLSISYGKNIIYMTGDASVDVINEHFACASLCEKESLIKVAHHGSITGTDNNVIELLKPTYAFIPVGYSKKYKHPHSSVIRILHARSELASNVILSRNICDYVCYELDGNTINLKKSV